MAIAFNNTSSYHFECFYEKVIKVKADVAALLTFLFFVAFATFPQKISR